MKAELLNALRGAGVAGVGLLAVVAFLLYILFYVALAALVFGGAYLVLKEIGVLMLIPLLI